MYMSHILFPLPFYLAYTCDCFDQYNTMVQVMLFAYPLIDLALSTSSPLEHLFLGCLLLEPSCHAVKRPLIGTWLPVPGDFTVEASISIQPCQ